MGKYINGKCRPDFYTLFLLYFEIFTYEPLNIIIVSNGARELFLLMALILIVTTVHIIF